ncbi:HK97 gp10 family phage protein [Phyllobacterium sp. A18/5-2]|uniref:HK97-gp10 family putative phage morphogenesis protein n=1 Tax=Phyllobacterium sp. A18/5-2 TaxID=2978392 RepID=UPI0021C57AA9|nr:HK97-gp10 family putative phage morphogenesis protein [Phyllobacterium sp. A18/5-2]UXN62905.1 HK97 gp10 family phage protein [Phyllobacterium sp. A18/5-2]
MVDGVSALTAELTKVLSARIRQAAKVAMEQGAEEVVAMMKQLAPVDDGDLQMSISWTWGKPPKGSRVIAKSNPDATGGPIITIFAGNEKAYYAAFQEFGTVKMRAHAFFFPSWRALRKRVRSRITRNVNKAIKAGSA